MRPLGVVPSDPLIQGILQLFNGLVDLLSKGDKEEFIPHGLVETFTDSIGLRTLCLGLGVVDVLNGQVKRVFVVLPFSTVLGSPVGQYAQQGRPFLLKEGDYPVIEKVGGRNGVLAVIKLYERYLAIGVDKGLRIDPADPFDGTDIVGVLCAQIARMVRFYLPVGLFLLLCTFQGL